MRWNGILDMGIVMNNPLTGGAFNAKDSVSYGTPGLQRSNSYAKVCLAFKEAPMVEEESSELPEQVQTALEVWRMA